MGNIQPKQEINEEEEPTFTCEICIEPKPVNNKFYNNNNNKCSHPFCTDCITKYIQVKLQQRVSNIPCPGLGCDQFLDHLHCRPLLPRRLLDKWCDLLFESAILGFDNWVYCPNRYCSELIVDECGGGDIRRAVCPKCKKAFCFHCAVPWHGGVGCMARDVDDERFRMVAKKKGWMRCPVCRHFVERNGGCNSVVCRCGTIFCYECGERTPLLRHRCPNRTITGCFRENWEILVVFFIVLLVVVIYSLLFIYR